MGQTSSDSKPPPHLWLVCGLPIAGKTSIQYKVESGELPMGPPKWMPPQVSQLGPTVNGWYTECREAVGWLFVDMLAPES